jgi:nitrate reductase NapAB chaperone NapD
MDPSEKYSAGLGSVAVLIGNLFFTHDGVLSDSTLANTSESFVVVEDKPVESRQLDRTVVQVVPLSLCFDVAVEEIVVVADGDETSSSIETFELLDVLAFIVSISFIFRQRTLSRFVCSLG